MLKRGVFLLLFINSLFISLSHCSPNTVQECNKNKDTKITITKESDLATVPQGCIAAVCCHNQVEFQMAIPTYFRQKDVTETPLYKSFKQLFPGKTIPAYCQPYIPNCFTLYLGLGWVSIPGVEGYRSAAALDKTQNLEDFHYTRFGESTPSDVKPLYSMMKKIYFRSMGMGRFEAVGSTKSKVKYTYDQLLKDGAANRTPAHQDLAKVLIGCGVNPTGWYTCMELFYLTCGGGIRPEQELIYLDNDSKPTLFVTPATKKNDFAAVQCTMVHQMLETFKTTPGTVEKCVVDQCTAVKLVPGGVSNRIKFFQGLNPTKPQN